MLTPPRTVRQKCLCDKNFVLKARVAKCPKNDWRRTANNYFGIFLSPFFIVRGNLGSYSPPSDVHQSMHTTCTLQYSPNSKNFLQYP